MKSLAGAAGPVAVRGPLKGQTTNYAAIAAGRKWEIWRRMCMLSPPARALSAYPRTVGDCPDFAVPWEQGTVGHVAARPMVGTVPFSETVLG